MPNECFDCKYNTLKIKILVPQNRTIKEYVHRTGDFRSDIVAIVKEGQGQYTVWFRSGSDINLLTFQMLYTCCLKTEGNKKEAACAYHEAKGKRDLISNIIYSKVPATEIIHSH
jgi:hypothetical protein